MKRTLPSLAYAVLSICTAGSARAQEASSESVAKVDAIFARWAHKETPGCTVAVSRDGQAIVTRAYGMADLELGVPAGVDSLYEAGSDSKQFTAAAILMLSRAGKLSLDDDIRKYLPEMPDYGSPVTLRNMLHHTSGLRDWGSVAAIEGWPRNSRTANNQDMLDIVARQKELNFQPGTHYLYSNTNFNLLAIVVDRVSGQSLADFTREHIFMPLGMTHTGWRDDHGRVVPGRTGAYDFEGGVYRNDQVIEDAYGNGGLLTTVGDLVKWQAALDSDRFGPGFTAAMEQPGALKDGTRIAYALALVDLEHHGIREVSHSGSTGGYRAWMARYPQQKLAVSLLCNAGNADTTQLGRDVADVFLPPFITKTYTPRGRLPTGLYADRMTGFPVRIEQDSAGKLQVEGRPLTPLAAGRWQAGGDVLAFGKTGLIRETREGERLPYDKVAAISAVDPAAFVGRYCGVDTTSCLTIAAGKAGLVYSGPRWADQPLARAYADVFTGGALPEASKIVVKFQRGPSGQVTGLRAGEGRAYDVLFRRAD